MTYKRKAAIHALVFWLIVGFGIGWFSNGMQSEELDMTESLGETALTEADMELFWDVWGTVQEEYIDAAELEVEDQIYGAISGMVDSLEDPYSDFMTPEETSEFQIALNGELEGIGAELTVREGRLVIVSPLKDTPAEQAGLLPGDHVYLVDGEPTSEMTIWDAIMMIRGERGTSVVLTILREGEEEPLEFTITRDEIVVPSTKVSYTEMNDKNLAIVSIYQFEDDTYSEFLNAVREITLNEVDGMVLDLRLNGGGYLDVSLMVLGQFFEDKVKGVIVKRSDGEGDVMYTQGDGDLVDMPLVVLIDEGSASASEIVAGALQDYDRAMLFGEQSFGKGSVQEYANLSGGASLRLTIARWFTPNDRTIDHLGITPDIEIEMETELIDTEDDIQLQAALEFLAQQ
jgi:carboxyl-terminal processing protease